MSLIERAVERLDQLKAAGVITDADMTPAVSSPAASSAPQRPVQPQTPAAAPEMPKQTPDVVIDLDRLSALGFVSPAQSNSPIAEQYRIIKRPLLRNVHGRGASPVENGNLMMVTSSVPGEGKSFTSINLALSIATELDHTVLLVDADVSKPSVLNALGLPPAPGLMDVLLGKRQMEDVLLRTSVDKLSLLPSGMQHHRATEFLASEGMNRLLEELATRYSDRIVIFDSPPLLVTTEARVLATHMGQVVMVVEAGRTTHGMVRQALSTIESCPVKLMLLNKVRNVGGAGQYGTYGYGYGYGRREAEAA